MKIVKPLLFICTLPVVMAAQAPAPKPQAKAPAAAKPKPAAVKPVAPKTVKPAKPAAAPAEPAVLTVGNERLTKADFERIVDSLPDRVRAQFSNPAGKRQFAEQLAELMAMSQEARRRKLDQDPKTQNQIRLQTNQILANAVYTQLQAGPLDEAALRKYFEENRNQYQQVTGRHILIRFKGSPVPVKPNQQDLTDGEALAKCQEIRKRIEAGADFAEIAKKESDDVGSGAAGGSLGAFGRGQMVKPFEDAAFSLPIGQLSEPVKSQFGYHLIQIQETKNQTFEQARNLIEQRRKPELARQAAEEIKKKAGVTLDEEYFGKK